MSNSGLRAIRKEGSEEMVPSNAPLWCKLSDREQLSDNGIYKIFKSAAKRAGIDKPGMDNPVTLTNFRKSSASYMASRGMSQAHLEKRYGWKRGSAVAALYVSVFSEESERETLKVWGKEPEEREEPPNVPRLRASGVRRKPRVKRICVWCGQALEPGAGQMADELEEWIVDRIASAESEEEQEAFKETWQEVRKNPEARAEAVDKLQEVLSG